MHLINVLNVKLPTTKMTSFRFWSVCVSTYNAMNLVLQLQSNKNANKYVNETLKYRRSLCWNWQFHYKRTKRRTTCMFFCEKCYFICIATIASDFNKIHVISSSNWFRPPNSIMSFRSISQNNSMAVYGSLYVVYWHRNRAHFGSPRARMALHINIRICFLMHFSTILWYYRCKSSCMTHQQHLRETETKSINNKALKRSFDKQFDLEETNGDDDALEILSQRRKEQNENSSYLMFQ